MVRLLAPNCIGFLFGEVPESSSRNTLTTLRFRGFLLKFLRQSLHNTFPFARGRPLHCRQRCNSGIVSVQHGVQEPSPALAVFLHPSAGHSRFALIYGPIYQELVP